MYKSKVHIHFLRVTIATLVLPCTVSEIHDFKGKNRNFLDPLTLQPSLVVNILDILDDLYMVSLVKLVSGASDVFIIFML